MMEILWQEKCKIFRRCRIVSLHEKKKGERRTRELSLQHFKTLWITSADFATSGLNKLWGPMVCVDFFYTLPVTNQVSPHDNH